MRFYLTIILFLFLYLQPTSGVAQHWDYEKNPPIPVDFQHMDADLKIMESSLIEGAVTYRIKFKVFGIDSLIFNAAHMDIKDISMGDSPLSFSIDGDRLVIYFEEHFEQNAITSLTIRYITESVFGIHQDSFNSIWTSFLPKTTRHWLPVVDHPRVSFTTRLSITHPPGTEVITNFSKVSNSVVSVSEENSVFETSQNMAASQLGWIIGEFELAASTSLERFGSSTSSSDNNLNNSDSLQVRVYSDSDIENLSEIMNQFRSDLAGVQNFYMSSYPYDQLHVVFMEDSMWEPINYAPGLIMVYRDQDDITGQLQLGILSQWIGTSLRPELWSKSDAINALRAVAANELFPAFETSSNKKIEPYHHLSVDKVQEWRNFFNQTDSLLFNRIIKQKISGIIKNQDRVYGWSDMARDIYIETGLPFFEIPKIDTVKVDSTMELIEYNVQLNWNELESEVDILFESQGEGVRELVTVQLTEFATNETRQHELTFTGQRDLIIVQLSDFVENITLNIVNRDDIVLNVNKPFQFWLHQLQNNQTEVKRLEAARGLASHTEEQDIQLALLDMLQLEMSPVVYAEILRTLAKITDGAMGTEQTFLDETRNENPVIQSAALEALANYPGNDRIISRIRSMILNSSSYEVRTTAIQSLAAVSESERFINFVEDFVTRDELLAHVPNLLKLLAEKNEESMSVQLAETFLADSFPFSIRIEILNLMIELDQSESGWESRFPALLTDRDPRIRYEAAKILQRAGSSFREEWISNRMNEEYDARILSVLQNSVN